MSDDYERWIERGLRPASDHDTENHTYIDPSDAAPHHKSRYERLRRYNTGEWKNRSMRDQEAVRERDNAAVFDAVSCRAGLSTWQKRRGRALLDGLDAQAIGGSIVATAVALCIVLTNDEARRRRNHKMFYDPSVPDAQNPDRYVELIEALDLTDSQVATALDGVSAQVDL